MAAPTTCTIQNLNGKFVMNKSLSDDFVALLEFVRPPAVPLPSLPTH